MTSLEMQRFLGNSPKYKLIFRNIKNPSIKKVVLCWRWYPEAHKGDIYASLSKNAPAVCIEDKDFYFDEVKELF